MTNSLCNEIPLSDTRVRARLAVCRALLIGGLLCSGNAVAGSPHNADFSEQTVRGTWIWSGLLRFGAPVPVAGTLVDGAPPQAMIVPGDVVGIWAATVGLMTFDGRGNVQHAEEVTKAGEIVPQPGLLPVDHLPPFPEVYTGKYQVSPEGVVGIQLTGRNLSSPEGKVDFEYDLHCVLNRWPREMTCVPARFKTFVVDPNGFPSPITGIIEFTRRY